jgi:metal-responsive CopG/Arc/MetJ family transcriptional regulator
VSRVAKVTISLPSNVLEAVEREREAKGETRSEFVVRAVEEYLRRERHRQDVERYIQGYKEMPETDEEIAEARTLATWSVSQEPWDDEVWEEDYRAQDARA